MKITEFQEIIKKFVVADENARALALEIRVPSVTVRRWASGKTVPGEHFRNVIVEAINRLESHDGNV